MGNGLTITGFGPSALAASSFATQAFAEAAMHPDLARLFTRGSRVARATKNLPQTATEALYTIVGGRILLFQILGEVTTVIQTQANNLRLQANPTATGSSVDICADLNVSALAVATLLGITGIFATAMQSGLSIVSQTTPTLLQAGTIDLVASASNTGQVKWDAFYVPLDTGATLVAA